MTMPDAAAREPADASRALAYLAALATSVAGLLLAELLFPFAGLENVDLVFLTLVVLVAARYGFGPALLAAVTSVLAYNFFFIPPVHTFEVADPKNLAALFFFLLFALAASSAAARARAQAVEAQRQTRRIDELYAFSRHITGAGTLDELAAMAVDKIGAMLDRSAFLLLPNGDGTLGVRSRSGEDEGDMDLQTLRTFWGGGSWAERKVMRIGDHLFYPLRSGGRISGLVGLTQRSLRESLSDEEDSLFEAVSEQLAAGLERARLAEERDEARLALEGERLRDSLFSSLSHDLRTPLASITGAATALSQFPDLYRGEERAELVGTIREEAERMLSFVSNLLDMSRLEAGGMVLHREPADLNEIAAGAIARMERAMSRHLVATGFGSNLPLLHVDPVLVEQAVVNLLENAAKYAPEGSTVTLSTCRDAAGLRMTVADEGPGVPEGDRSRIFDKFHRASRGDRQRAGTGLGLAICRGFVEANGGTVAASKRADWSGAVFTITFPDSTFVPALPAGAIDG